MEELYNEGLAQMAKLFPPSLEDWDKIEDSPPLLFRDMDFIPMLKLIEELELSDWHALAVFR